MKLWQFLSVILILSISPLEISGQNNSGIVSGSVFNSGQEPLVGVSVFVKGTNIGTMTDADGRFSVKAENGQNLEFRYIGYDTKVVTVNGKTMSVTMSENQVILDDVVVIGYGTQKKSDLTGSLSSVKGEDIVKTGDTNITQSLQGKAPGVYVTSNSGTPGAGATIRIRGYGSISTDLTPLYVVDGQPMEESSVNTINPIDIENIEVLKDASATAIYGSRGANGVILITTKKGKSGKTSITFDASFGWSNAINRVHMMNSDQLYSFLEEAYENDGMRMPRNITRLYHLDGEGLGPVDEYGEPTDINVYDTDWWNETTQTAFKHSYNLSVSGGTDKLTSHFSIGYLNQEGIVMTSDYERITLRVNNEYKFNKWITIGQTLGAAYVKSHDLNTPINEILLPDPFSPIYAKNADKQDPNYEFNKYMGSQYSYYSNPVAKLNRQKKEHLNRNIDGTAYLNINLGLKGLDFKTMLGFELPEYTYTEFNPFFDLRPNDTPYNMCTNVESKFLLKNSVANTSSTELNYTFQNTLSYNNQFGKHSISAVAGFTWEAYTGRSFTAERLNTPSNSDAFQIVGAGTKEGTSTGSRYENYLISYLGRINYNYADRYLATVSVRADGSSKFAPGNRWGTFPSFSLGWRIDQEEFYKDWNQNVLSAVKLRGGWGQIGNQNIPSFAYADVVSTYDTWVYGFNSGLNLLKAYASTSKGNKDIKWETVEQGNIGVDLGFFKNSLTLSADAYIKTTRDMLMQNPLPGMAGYPTTPWRPARGGSRAGPLPAGQTPRGAGGERKRSGGAPVRHRGPLREGPRRGGRRAGEAPRPGDPAEGGASLRARLGLRHGGALPGTAPRAARPARGGREGAPRAGARRAPRRAVQPGEARRMRPGLPDARSHAGRPGRARGQLLFADNEPLQRQPVRGGLRAGPRAAGAAGGPLSARELHAGAGAGDRPALPRARIARARRQPGPPRSR